MTLNNRQKQILNELKASRQVRVTKLAKKLFASEMTIRRDLAYLEKEGFLIRCHGGAVPIGNHLLYPIKYRMWINTKEKKDLALAAKKYLKDGQVIFFNSSSTTSYLIPYLKEYKDLHIITNSVHLLSLLGTLHISCTLTGGDYHEVEQCLCGGGAEAYLSDINPDLAILSCEGITEDGEITDSHEEMARIARIACKNAKQVVFLMDTSKQESKYTYTVCRVAEHDNIIVLPPHNQP